MQVTYPSKPGPGAAREWSPGGPGDAAAQAAQRAARRGNRRRLAVFGGVFLLAMLLGQGWNLSRPDQFRASMRLQVSLPNAAGPGQAASAAYGSELQTLNARPLLAKLAQAMAEAGQPLAASPDEAVQILQKMLRISLVEGTQVLLVEASGPTPSPLAEVLAAHAELVRQELGANQARTADSEAVHARAELARLDAATAERQAKLERFREAAGLQAEREESDAVNASKGLANALNQAVEKQATLDAKVQSLRDAAAAGNGVSRAKDDPTLAALEARAALAREDLRDMERSFTPEFLALDPKAKSLRARLAELERQIASQRQTGMQAQLQSAQEELASAQTTAERLRQQVAAARPALNSASARYAQAKALAEDLAQVQLARRQTLERVTRLEADLQRAVPQVAVLEAAEPPQQPIAPDRLRDGVAVSAAALLLALLAMALVETFNRSPLPQAPGANTALLMPAWGLPAPSLVEAMAATAPGLIGAADAPLLLAGNAHPPPRPVPPRPILQQHEVLQLLRATRSATDPLKPEPALILSSLALLGLRTPELLVLKAADVDAAAARLRVAGAGSRSVALPHWLAAALARAVAGAAADAPLLADAAGQALDEAALHSLLACSAVDAGLAQGAGLSLAMLRDTCLDHLSGQGLRFAELPALVGRIEAADVAAFADRAAGLPRRSLHEVVWPMPALAEALDAMVLPLA